jgi:hypothetical protein
MTFNLNTCLQLVKILNYKETKERWVNLDEGIHMMQQPGAATLTSWGGGQPLTPQTPAAFTELRFIARFLRSKMCTFKKLNLLVSLIGVNFNRKNVIIIVKYIS